jgi:SAM-dependent methyltransferase
MFMNVGVESQSYFRRQDLNRSIGEVNRGFIAAFNHDTSPTSRALEIVRKQGSVTLLDAGCGSGQALADLKDQVMMMARKRTERIRAIGVDLNDYRQYIDDPLLKHRAYNPDYMTVVRADLQQPVLQPETVDMAYSFEVLMHNEDPVRIISNIAEVLKAGGVYYCNSLPEQQTDIAVYSDELRVEGWDVLSVPHTETFYNGVTDTRFFHCFSKPSVAAV